MDSEQTGKLALPPSPPVSWITKLILRSVSILFSVIVIILYSITIIWNTHFQTHYFIVIAGPVAGSAILWGIADIVCISTRACRRGLRPGACVALDMLLWMGLIIVAFFSAGSLSAEFSGGRYSYHYGNIYTAAFVFVIMLIPIHVAIFVIACYETHARRRLFQVVA